MEMKMKHTPESWAIGEYWSSSRPHRKVLVLSQGEADILMDESHHSFIRWVFKSEHADLLQKQRDELLAAMIHIQQVACSGSPELGIATDAIASVKGEQ